MRRLYLLLCITCISCANDKVGSKKIICNNGYEVYIDSLNNLTGIRYKAGSDSLIILLKKNIHFYAFNENTMEKIYSIDKIGRLYKIKYISCNDTLNCLEQIINVDTTSKQFSVNQHSSFISTIGILDTIDLGRKVIVNHRLHDSVFPLFKLNISSSKNRFEIKRKKNSKAIKFYNSKGASDTIVYLNKGINFYNGYIENYKVLKDSSIAAIRHFFSYKIYIK